MYNTSMLRKIANYGLYNYTSSTGGYQMKRRQVLYKTITYFKRREFVKNTSHFKQNCKNTISTKKL